MTIRVHVAVRDLFFRSKLRSVIQEQQAEIASSDAEADLAVIELGAQGAGGAGGAGSAGGAMDVIRSFISRGVRVLAFGSHKSPDVLREARSAGAEAVANSEVERRLRALLAEEIDE